MNRVYAYKTNKVTSTGKAVYGIAFPESADDRDMLNFDVANLRDLEAGDDTWAHVLDENREFVIVNEAGLIDIDRAAYEADADAAAARRAAAWDKEDDYPGYEAGY